MKHDITVIENTSPKSQSNTDETFKPIRNQCGSFPRVKKQPLRDCTNFIGSPTPTEEVLTFHRGQWRDAGFWQKVVTPGGSKSFKRRKGLDTVINHVNMTDVDNREHSSPTQIKFDPSTERFSDDWEAALNVEEKQNGSPFLTLPRNYKPSSALQRQSLPGAAVLSFPKDSPLSVVAKSPYLYFKSKLNGKASRLSFSPLRGPHKPSSDDYLHRFSISRKQTLARGSIETCPHSSTWGYHHSGSRPSVCSHCALIRTMSASTLPRAGLTRMPPTPPSPRRPPNSSWWTRLSTTTRELQTLSSNTLCAIASYPPPDVVLHGPDVTINWGAETGSSSSSSTADAGRRAGRKHSLTRPLHRRPDRAAPSDNEHAGGGDSRGGSSEGAPSEAGDRVQAWATSFEKLLEDPVGLHTFTEFLRKEYSHENIYFWTACERYRLGISSDPSGNNNNNADSNKPWSEWSGKHAAAKTIYNTHLGDNAPEPVNVDAQARQMAQEGLRQPTQDLFAAAQKQVFSLMKFDSYSRFLKSALYEECLEREARGEDIQYGSQESLDPNLVILPSQLHHTSASDAQNANNFSKGKTELEERRRRSLLPWHRSKDRSKSKDRLLSGSSDARNAAASKNKRSLATAVGSKDNSSTKAKSLSASASRLVRGPSSDATPSGAGVRSNSVSRVVSSRHTSESSGSIGKTSDVSGSRTSLNSGCEGALLAGRKAVSKESLTSSDCVSLSGGEGSGGAATGRCRVVLPDRSQSVVAVRAGVSVDRVMRRLMDRRGLTFLAYNVVMAGKGDRLVSGSDDSSVLCGTEVRLQQLVLFRLDLPNQKTVCVKAKPHKMASDVLRPILAKYGFKLDLMHIHTAEDNPRPVNVKGQITELDGQKFIVQTKEDVKEWGLSGVGNGVGAPGSSHDSDALDAITNRVFEDLLQSKTSHQLLTNCDYDARSAKTEACSDYSGGVCGSLGRHSALPDKDRVGDAPAVGRNTSTGNRSLSSPSKDNDELYEGLKRAQMSRIEDQRGTKINSELPDFLKCDSENKENEMNVDEPDEPHFLPPDSGPTATALYFNSARTADPQYHPFYSQHHHHHHHHHFHFTPASQHQPPHPQLCPPEETSPSDEQSQFLPSSTTPLQQSSSSLTQHQAHHNFWSDISGGGSSIPSSLLATSSSSLSSSTGLPMSSSTNFEGIDTPLTIASNFLLDMHYDGPEISSRTKLRPRPESCVNTRPDAIMRADQANRPKSSCGSLTASPDRTLLAPPDLDKTLSSNTSMDHTGDIFSDVAMRGIEAEETGQPTRLQASVRPPLQQHLRGTQYLRRRDHHHPSPLDCVMSQLASTGSNGLVSSASHLSDFSPLINSVDAGAVNINASGMSARPSANGSFNGNMSTPPPPLPPKPKLGAPARGPPPRPPSRQLPLGPTSTSGYVAGLLDGTALKLRGPGPCDMSSNQKLHNKDTVSFV